MAKLPPPVSIIRTGDPWDTEKYDFDLTFYAYRDRLIPPNPNDENPHPVYETILVTTTVHTTVTASVSVVVNWVNTHRQGAYIIGLDFQLSRGGAAEEDTDSDVEDGEHENPTVSVITVCINTNCLIFQIAHAGYFPAELVDLLGDPHYRIVGSHLFYYAYLLDNEHDIQFAQSLWYRIEDYNIFGDDVSLSAGHHFNYLIPEVDMVEDRRWWKRLLSVKRIKMELKFLDPFLMLDEFSVSAPAGFPDHPHRGFETVTYMLQGSFTHQDFAGHKGTIRAGDLQWMTAGRGIIHSEMPAGEGVQSGLQLWINLPSKDKMIEPGYQELQCEEIKRVEKDGVEVRIIAGVAIGVKSPVYTRTPIMYLDFTLKPGAQLHQRIPDSWNAFVDVIEGEGIFGSLSSSPANAHHALVLGPGDGLSVWNKYINPLRFFLIGGQPLNEPVVQNGPFVMNTEAEIDQAIEDYQFCRNGFEKAKHWKSRS